MRNNDRRETRSIRRPRDGRVLLRQVRRPARRRRFVALEQLEERRLLSAGPLRASDLTSPSWSAAVAEAASTEHAAADVVLRGAASGVARLSLPQTLTAGPGDTLQVPVRLDSIVDLQPPNRLAGADLVLLFDTDVLTATAVTAGGFINNDPTWSFVPNIDNSLGRIIVVAFTTRPVSGTFSEDLVNLEFTVNANAPRGQSAINLVEFSDGVITGLTDESDGFLALDGPVTNAPTDPIDGVVTIIDDMPTVTLSTDVATIQEGGSPATLTATLTGSAAGEVVVELGYSGSATPGVDFTGPTQIVIAPGNLSGTAALAAPEDGLNELNETVIVDVTTVTNANEATPQTVTIVIRDAASWTNSRNPLDVNDDGFVAPSDVLVTINELNLRLIIDAVGRLPETRAAGQFFYDVNSDGFATPRDVLDIINELNERVQGEQEPAASLVPTWIPPQSPSPSLASQRTRDGAQRDWQRNRAPAILPPIVADRHPARDHRAVNPTAVDRLIGGEQSLDELLEERVWIPDAADS